MRLISLEISHGYWVFLLLIMASCITGGYGVDCFKCDSVWTVRECMQQDPETCGVGEICSNTVSIGQFAGKKYTKGCMDAARCYSLEGLNDRKSCNLDPAICVHCCEAELCNTAVTSHPVGFILYALTSIVTTVLYV